MNENWAGMVSWYRLFAREFKRLQPTTRLHVSALSPAGRYREGWKEFRDAGLALHHDVADVHIYNEAQLVDAQILHEITGLPVCVTEINQLPPSFYVPKFAQMPFVDGAVWFTSRWIGPPEGSPNVDLIGGPFYDDFRAIAQSANMPVADGPPTASGGIPELQPVHGGNMAEFKLGFLDKALALGEAIVGVPVMDQASIPLGDGRTYTLQLTTRGQMVYTEGGQPLFLPAYFPLP